MGAGPTFNIETKFDGPEEAQEFFENELLPFLEENFEDVCDVSPPDTPWDHLRYEFGIPDNGRSFEVGYAETSDSYLGNLGNWPAIVIAYQPYYSAEMPHAKRHIEALDEIRDFLIKKKPASDVKYYVATRNI